jgi:hypothetical protein
MWYDLSASNGKPFPNQYKERKIVPKMSSAQITVAKQRVTEWRPNPAECEVHTSKSGA